MSGRDQAERFAVTTRLAARINLGVIVIVIVMVIVVVGVEVEVGLRQRERRGLVPVVPEEIACVENVASFLRCYRAAEKS